MYILIDASWSAERLKYRFLKTANDYSKLGYRTTIFTFSKTLEQLSDKEYYHLLDDYDIGGATALYDCMDELFEMVDQERPFIVILTDGNDTSSTTCRKTDLENLMFKLRWKGWTFEFPHVNPFRKNPLCF